MAMQSVKIIPALARIAKFYILILKFFITAKTFHIKEVCSIGYLNTT